jgi:hypothetical protein
MTGSNAVTAEPAPQFAGLPRAIMRWMLAALFVAAGVAHIATPEPLS